MPNRRDFLKTVPLAGAAYALPRSAAAPRSSGKNDKLQIAILGSGFRGQSHIGLLLERTDCVVSAVADIDPRMVERTRQLFKDKNAVQPTYYTAGPYDYRELLEREELDAVLIATPWEWHTEMSVAAMERGLFVGTEVCGAFSVDECQQLVDTSERTGSHLFFLENVCYRRDVMAVLRMVREGLFGELIHLECGYQHDLRAVKFNDGEQAYGGGVKFGPEAFHEARWRTLHSVHRNGDLYPTHGIGPVAQFVNLGRGNRMVSLTSTASKARGLHDYIVRHPKGGRDHHNAAVEFALGDKITTVVRTARGESIVLHHDTNLPRPYSLGFRVQGTRGLWMKDGNQIHLAGTSPDHRWEASQPYLDRYDHPLWKRYEQQATGAGHGGMDFFLINAFVEHARRKIAPPFDVYDAAAWMAITPLSEQSIAQGGMPQQFPDFTRGRWMTRESDFGKSDLF